VREPLSVLVATLDEEGTLPTCLASVEFADEIVVVDSGSRDRTCEIARSYGAKVLEHPFESHARQKNWGLAQLTNAWVLALDADERVTPELGGEIARVLGGNDKGAKGYWISRDNYFLGRRIRGCGWQRDRVLRLFDRRSARYDERLVHERIELEGEVGALAHCLLHESCRDLSSWVAKTTRYATLGAEDAWARGRRARAIDLVMRPPARFLKQYFLQAGFRDGVEGGILCAVSAFGVFLKYARLLEFSRTRESAAPSKR
jgi:glycosyltransferase involved in cell wall biosynthesis